MTHSPNGILGNFLPDIQTDYWIEPGGDPHKIGQWPRNGSLRAQTKYRNFEGQKDDPIATRYLVNVTAVDLFPPFPLPDLDIWAWLDIPDGSSNDFEGSTQLSPFVPRCEFHIFHDAVLPNLGVSGTRILATWFNTLGSFSTTFEWKDQGGVGFNPRVNTRDSPPDGRFESAPGFGYNDRNCEVYAMSECYDFPIEPSLIIGEAAFDGATAYISLAQLMTFTDNPFRLSCEVNLNQTANHWPILGREALGGFFGMRAADIIFGNLTLPTTWTPVTGVWLTWVYEFKPVTLLQHKLTIAGVVVRDSTNARQFVPANNLGVYKHNVPGTLWADMGMRNLKIETGTPGSYTTLLDMPLLVNALDLGPQANHGTTFNMPLPST